MKDRTVASDAGGAVWCGGGGRGDQMKLVVLLFFLAVLATSVTKCKDERAATERAQADGRARAAADQQRDERHAKCAAERQALLDRYRSLIDGKKPGDAASVLRSCADVLNDTDMVRMVREADIIDLRAAAADTKRSIRERIMVLDRLSSQYPGAYKGSEKLYSQLQAKADAEDRAERKRRGVSIGMQQEEVLQSSWGRPRKVNRTVTQRGVREQWVYDGGYLYFEDGVLTAIQN